MAKRSYLRLNARKEFDHSLDHLVTEVNRANDHWYLWKHLNGAAKEFALEMGQSPAFWTLTVRAHVDSVIMRLGRLYDATSGALSIGNLLHSIKHRVSECPGDTLGLDIAELDKSALDAEIAAVTESDADVRRLIKFRNKYMAHRDANLVGTGTFAGLGAIPAEEIERLLKRASQIASKYGKIYRNMAASPLPGIDDYKGLLDLARRGLESMKAERAEERGGE